MACITLTQSFDANSFCRPTTAGIKRVLISPWVNVDTVTKTANVVTGITMKASNVFREYILAKQKGFFTDNETTSVENNTIIYKPTIDFTINGLTSAVRHELRLLCTAPLMMIVEDKNGDYYLFGELNGMDLLTISTESGTMMEDFNGQKLHFEGKETHPIYNVSSGIIAGLL